MKPLWKNTAEIVGALKEIEESDSFKANVRLEAGSIADKVDDAFICSTCFWYDILSRVNIASKALQSIKANLEGAR